MEIDSTMITLAAVLFCIVYAPATWIMFRNVRLLGILKYPASGFSVGDPTSCGPLHENGASYRGCKSSPLFTLRTFPGRVGNLLHPHIDPVRGQVQLHFLHSPGMAQSQKRA